MLSDSIERKFIDSIELEEGWEILTDDGYKPITNIYKTVPYKEYTIKTETHSLICADTHIIYKEDFTEVFAKDLLCGDFILTDTGPECVTEVIISDKESNMYDVTVNDNNHRFYSNGILSHNTVSYVCFIVWYMIFNKDQKIALLANKGNTARSILARVELAYQELPRWLQSGVTSWNKGSFSLENGNSIIATTTSASNIRGESMNMTIIDECAFVPHWTEFFSSVFPTLSSSKTSRCILVSTFNGQNHFYDIWSAAQNGDSVFVPSRVDWWDVPGRDEKWKREQLGVMSEEQFNQEYGNEPLGSGNTLLSPKCFTNMNRTVKEAVEKSVDIKIYERPQRNHSYFLSCDCANGGGDYSVVQIIDVTRLPYRQVAVYKNAKISHLQFPGIIYQFSKKYNNAEILVESNDVGNAVLDILLLEYDCDNIIRERYAKAKRRLGIRTTMRTKSIGCSTVRSMIEKGSLIIQDKDTIDEFRHFVESNGSYEAEDAFHDDLAMALVIFAYCTQTEAFMVNHDVGYYEQMKSDYDAEAMESLAPLPMFSETGNDMYGALDEDTIKWLNR